VPLIEQFLVADVRADFGLPRDAVSTWLKGDAMVALFPLPGADLWRVLAPLPEGADPAGVLPDLLAERAGLPAPRTVEWISTFRIQRRLAETFRRGHVFLAGDAAHIHSPMGGQGMNTGMSDAENLAWKLALVEHGRAGEGLLDTYQAERRPVAEEVLGNTSSMTTTMLGRNPFERLMRDHVVVPLMNRPLVQRMINEAASQLRVSYRRGPLGSAYPLKPRPGDRIPDLACARPDGSQTRLHAELRGRWAILTSDDAAAQIAKNHLGQTQVTILPFKQTLLVRPDAHLACRGTAKDLDRWLSRALGPQVPAGASA